MAARRWWAGLTVVVALFFATSVVAATPQTRLVQAPSVLQAVVPSPSSMGHRPDLQFADHGGQGHAASSPTAYAWLAERVVASTITWWHRRRDNDGQRAQTGRRVYQGRGPPGRRAADATS
ncbi:hypothetical protein [Paractinoplanes lichenicola]|uniref:Uncharacterized protein n=1 Tax=Paractinoplanes lichenicola TaxID=2802976 RepID=A0ABS1W069_9ACTN|nr:hypothetical protein [Actinoplanes lichenicola]MBL7260083.1 hypothetical protein [Actinoplanes lichenicola]